MKWLYLVIPAAAVAGILTSYLPAQYSRHVEFALEGPGQIHEFRSIKRISWFEGTRRGSLENPDAIREIVAAVGTDFGDWKRQRIAWKPGFLPVIFHDADSPRVVTVYLGPGFALSGEYSRFLPTTTVAAVRSELETNSKIVIWDDRKWKD